MLLKWMKFSRDAARLGYEVQTVMTLRMLKFARGGKAAKTEARRMVAEKGLAFARGRCDARHRRLDEEGRPPRPLPCEQEQAPPLALVLGASMRPRCRLMSTRPRLRTHTAR